MSRTYPAVFIAALLAGHALMAQQDTTKHHAPPSTAAGRILGVFDDGTDMPLNNAEIVDVLAGRSFRTQPSGLIGLAGIRRQNDSAVVRVRKLGYADTTLLVMLSATDTVPLQLFLHRVTTLPRVVTEAMETSHRDGGLRDFYDFVNDRSLHVRYLTPFDLRKNDEKTLRQVLPSLGYGQGRCKSPIVYLNGMRVDISNFDAMPRSAPTIGPAGMAALAAKGSAALSLDEPLANYEAIEFFPDNAAPMPYGKCTLLLWIRGS
jgi:hypothetical protein